MKTQAERRAELKASINALVDDAKALGDDELEEALLMCANIVDFRTSRSDRLIATGMSLIISKQLVAECNRLNKYDTL